MSSQMPEERKIAGNVDELTVRRTSRGKDPMGEMRDRQQGYIIPRLKAALKGTRYDEGKEIGKGQYGRVFSVKEFPLEREIAKKVLRLDVELPAAQELIAVQMFMREAMVLGQLQHPNIVPLYELGVEPFLRTGRTNAPQNISSKDELGEESSPETADTLYYTMRLVRGGTLKDVIEDVILKDNSPAVGKGNTKERGKYDLQALLTIFDKVCDAMSYAHAHPLCVIHGDLKPRNIMVGDYGEVYVMDWGLAKVMGDTKDLGYIVSDAGKGGDGEGAEVTKAMGTPRYLSPEQADGESDQIDETSDVYALGGILHEMLTLRPPVEITEEEQGLREVECLLQKTRDGQVALRMKQSKQERRKMRAAHCDGGYVPESLVAVVLKALSLKKTDRYKTVLELQKEVQKFLAGHATLAENAGAWRRAAYFVKRHKAVSMVVASALLLIASSFALFTQKVTQEHAKVRRERDNARKERDERDEAVWRLRSALATAFVYQGHMEMQVNGNFRKALESYEQANALNPNDVSVYAGLAIAKEELKELSGTILSLNHWIGLDPKNVIPRRMRAAAKYKLKDYVGAISDFSKVIDELDPSDASAYEGRGKAKMDLIDYDGAITDFDKAIELDPGNALPRFYRGVTKNNLGDHAGALGDFSMAIELYPNFEWAYWFRAAMKHLLEDYAGSIVDFSQAIKLNPKEDSAYAERGMAKYALNDYDGAMLDYDTAIELNAGNAPAYFYRGLAKQHRKDYAGAMLDYDRKIELNPNDADSYNNRGLVKRILRDYEGAIVDFEKAIKIKPSKASTYNNRGLAKVSLNDYAGAILDLDEAIKLDPGRVAAYRDRGSVKVALKDNAGAISDYDKAIEMDPTNPYPLYCLWVIYTKQGDAEKVALVLSSIAKMVAINAHSQDWDRKIAGYLNGSSSETSFLFAAVSEDLEEQAEHYCEATCFIGVKALANGDKTKAAENFQKSVQTRCVDLVVYKMAELELEELREK